MTGSWRIDEHLSERDTRILEDIEKYRLLTTRQIQRLHLPAAPYGDHVSVSAATRGTTRILRRLEDLDAIRHLDRRIGGVKHGSALTIWQLGAVGERYLRTRSGITNRRRYREPGLTFVSHTLAVRDVIALVSERALAANYDVLGIEVEPDCWRTFTAPGGEPITLKPDLFIVTADADTETHSFVEVDQGTEHLPALLRKCRIYQRYYQTGSEQARGGLFPAVVWIIPDSLRAQKLQTAITTDTHLETDLFWIITPEQTLATLAPYGPFST